LRERGDDRPGVRDPAKVYALQEASHGWRANCTTHGLPLTTEPLEALVHAAAQALELLLAHTPLSGVIRYHGLAREKAALVNGLLLAITGRVRVWLHHRKQPIWCDPQSP